MNRPVLWRKAASGLALPRQSLMRRISVKSAAHSEAGLIPLINIVFLLLVFFMLAGRIESMTNVQVPLTQHQTAHDPAALEHQEWVLDRNGQWFVQGQPLSEKALAQQWAVASSKSLSGTPHLVVRADAQLPAHRLYHAFEQLSALEIQEIVLITQAGSTLSVLGGGQVSGDQL